jgi:hypothetical protein
VAISRPCYTSRETVARALEAKETARRNAQIDRAIEAASDTIDGGAQGANRGAGLLHRRLWPETATRYFDWPADSRPWRLWLGQHDLISVTSLTAADEAIAASDYFLRPDDGPPYDRIEIDLGGPAAFTAGTTTQRAVAITGVWGYTADTAPAGALNGAINASVTSLTVTDSSQVGVGDLIVIDTERLLVTNKTMADTGVNIAAADSLTATKNDVSITLSTATNAPAVDEVILIDSERMLVTDVAGTVATVIRAYDGTVLAAHAAAADIYAPRALTVRRAATGSTAASHSDAAAVSRWVAPPLVRDLALGLALNQVLQEGSGYARVAGAGDHQREFTGRGIAALTKDVCRAYGRRARTGAV